MKSESEVLEYLKNGTLVGLLPVPHPIIIRKYQPSDSTEVWFHTYIWGVIYVRWVMESLGGVSCTLVMPLKSWTFWKLWTFLVSLIQELRPSCMVRYYHQPIPCEQDQCFITLPISVGVVYSHSTLNAWLFWERLSNTHVVQGDGWPTLAHFCLSQIKCPMLQSFKTKFIALEI